jgi:hypothetical protein
MNRRILVPSVAALLILSTGFVLGEISAKYPHMREAQKFGKQAYNELTMVDHHHGPKVDEHVNKAKADLQDADHELEAAAMEADKTGH